MTSQFKKSYECLGLEIKSHLVILILVAGLIGFSLIPAVPQLVFLTVEYFTCAGKINFYLHQSRYNSIVEEVKKSALGLGELKEFKFALSGDGSEVEKIYAEKDKNGKLLVRIVTLDQGHAGRYGYAHSEIPLDPVPEGWGEVLVKKINDSWWTAHWNSD